MDIFLSPMEEWTRNEYAPLLMLKIITQLFDNIPLLNSQMCLSKLNKTIEGNDSDKVDYYLKLLKERNLLPDAASLEEKKDDNKSEKVRKEGNLFFASKPPKYLNALKAYNKSLCFAISKDNQCLALTNRSAVFFKMEMFHECLESIRLAREVGLLASVQEKVELRAKMCQEKLKKMRQEEPFIPKIGMPVNEKIPFLAKCLKLRENKQYGRYVVTDKDIPAGTIIAMKETFCNTIHNKDKYLLCTNCFAEHTHLLIPCDTCTQAMFCSKECKEKAAKDFHAIECPISGSLYKTFDIYYLLAIRMTIKAYLAFPDTETMVVALEKIDKEQKNVFNYDWTQELSHADLYAPIRTLISKGCETPIGVYLGTCLAFNLLKNSCPIFSQRYLTSSNLDNLLKNLMCKHIHTVNMNAISYSNLLITEDPRDGFGTAICGFLSLINHSCVSNVTPFVMGSIYGIVTTKNIPQGTQLFIVYDETHHTNADRDSRREVLSSRYAFHCQCEACVKDFPTALSLPVPRNIPELPFYMKNATNLREEFSVEFNKRGFKLTSDYIRKYNNFYPCLQLCQAQAEMLACLMHLSVVPLAIREKIINDQ